MKNYPEQIVMKGEGVRGGFYWPSLIKLSDGRLMAGCSGFRVKHVCPFGEVAVAFSDDEGKTWTQPKSVLNTPLDDRDAGLCEFNGKIIVTTFNNTRAFQLHEVALNNHHLTEEQKKMFIDKICTVTYAQEAKYLGSQMFYSEDGGETFSEPHRLPVSAPHGMIKLQDGTLFYVGRYFSDALPQPKGTFKDGIAIITSKDGINFSEPMDLKLPDEWNKPGYLFCEPHAVQLKSGKIIVAIRVHFPEPNTGVYINGNYTIYTCESTDNGKTFTLPKRISVPGDEGNFRGSPPHLIQHSSGAVIMSYAKRNPPCGEGVVVSYDEGRTWSKEYMLNREPNPKCDDIGYPATVELSNGDLYTIYYTHRDTNSAINAVRWNLKDLVED